VDLRSAPSFELFLFTRDGALARSAIAAGVDGIVIDLERNGKRIRQIGADTEVNEDTIEDLRFMRGMTTARILCRINAVGGDTKHEVEAVIAAGADELLLPMVRDIDDVECVLDVANGRIGVGILVETRDAVANAGRLGRLPLTRAFVGLNDLAIERRSPSIFSPLSDGTVAEVRNAFRARFGVAGLTIPEGGDPLPSRLLAGELARLQCDFTFLRRSFKRDTRDRSLDIEVPRIRDALRTAWNRSRDDVERDRVELATRISVLERATRSTGRRHSQPDKGAALPCESS
jgi:hypothetical protein